MKWIESPEQKTGVYLWLYQKDKLLKNLAHFCWSIDIVVNFVWLNTRDHNFVGYLQSFRKPWAWLAWRLLLNDSVDHKAQNVSENRKFWYALHKLGPNFVQFSINLSNLLWEFALMNSIQYPIDDPVWFRTVNKLITNNRFVDGLRHHDAHATSL